jgi:hypothetical protein
MTFKLVNKYSANAQSFHALAAVFVSGEHTDNPVYIHLYVW